MHSRVVTDQAFREQVQQIWLPLFTPPRTTANRGWPLRKEVVALELAAVTARVTGVTAVRDLLLAGDGNAVPSIPMRGLELPRIAGIEVSVGAVVPIDDLSDSDPFSLPSGPVLQPVPVLEGELPEGVRLAQISAVDDVTPPPASGATIVVSPSTVSAKYCAITGTAVRWSTG